MLLGKVLNSNLRAGEDRCSSSSIQAERESEFCLTQPFCCIPAFDTVDEAYHFGEDNLLH